MKRKSALATAAAITGTLFAAGAAAALNTAILDSSPNSGVGGVAPVVATASDDVMATMPTTATTQAVSPGSVGTLPTIRSTGSDPVTTSAGSSVAGGSSYDDDDDDDHESGEYESDEHESEEHEYEGHDDDD